MKLQFARKILGSSFLAISAAAALTLTGCTDSFNNAVTGTTIATQGNAFTGNVHGGRQPIANATVTVYAMGKNGYGSAGAALASTTTDLNGNFSFGLASGHAYACPPATSATLSQSLYITAVGGNPNGSTGSSNPTTYLMTVLQGNCTNVITTQPFVVINELTTVASMFALQQFFVPGTTVGGTFGTSATNSQGLLNAIATAGNLINLQSGIPVASTTVSGAVTGYTTAPVVTITPEEAKLDTLADILAACVNTDGSATNNNSQPTNCYTLYNDVSSPAVSDTLQAAYYLATNPTSKTGTTSNITALYNLATPTSPYQPTLSAAPSDWTVGVTYGSNSAQTVSGTSVYLLTRPETVAIDSVGNVWIDNYSSTTLGAVGNSVTELSPTGAPMKQVFASSTTFAGSFSLAIDPSNNVYATSYGKSGTFGSQVFEYTAGGATNTFTTAAGPTALTSDGAGDIFVTTTSGTGGGADLEAIPPSSTTGTVATQLATNITDSSFSEIAVDSNGTLWVGTAVSPSSTSTTTYKGTTQFICSAATATTPPSCAGTAVTGGSQGAAEPVAIDASGNVIVGSFSSTAGVITAIGANTTNTNFTYPLILSGATDLGVNNEQKLTVDGASNIWSSEYSTAAGAGISEFSSTGSVLSPNTATGFVHTYANPTKVAIDGSGNVWVGNAGTAAIATSTSNGFITEIVGQAVPVVTPIAAGLPVTAGGTNRLGTRP